MKKVTRARMGALRRNAPIIARHEITIGAPLETVWQLHTPIAGWPDWNRDIHRPELTAPIAVGQFHWETAGLPISSTISEAVPRRWLGVGL